MELVARLDPTYVERADIGSERRRLRTQIRHRRHRVAERRILLATALRLLITFPQPLPHARPHQAHLLQVDLP
ncbi:hypothetical protein D3C81_1250480 [compost metagenome]